MKQYLIIGNGVAGARAAIKIRERDPEGEIHMFTGEAYPFYYRVRFPEMVGGGVTIKDITIHTREFYQGKKISLHLEEPIVEVRTAQRKVFSKSGQSYSYDLLLLATGGNAFIPPIQGNDKKGVFTLRTMQDAIEMKAYSEGIHQAILIGGGLVGLETGGALLRRGIKVAVIEQNPRILPRQMDPEGAQILQGKMENMGFSFFLNGQSEAILGKEKVEGVRLKDGRVVEGQMAIISAGVRPNIQLAKEMGLEVKNGILVNNRLETKTESIFAAGDVAEHRGRVYGIWPAAQKQGEIAGINMAGGNESYEGTVISNTLKVVGIDLTSTGEIDAEGNLECVVRSDRENCNYCKVTFKEDKIVGCILLGETKGKTEILNAIEKEVNIRELKNSILKEEFDFKQLE
ncbi:MAG: NAD(P)/FAD-dependent oxidoreductase [Deltaproteobacteria bacterium]|nr:NAD(P)/FAD-dependent oxidoreductase [Deltaproteobacteria bacterium]